MRSGRLVSWWSRERHFVVALLVLLPLLVLQFWLAPDDVGPAGAVGGTVNPIPVNVADGNCSVVTTAHTTLGTSSGTWQTGDTADNISGVPGASGKVPSSAYTFNCTGISFSAEKAAVIQQWFEIGGYWYGFEIEDCGTTAGSCGSNQADTSALANMTVNWTGANGTDNCLPGYTALACNTDLPVLDTTGTGNSGQGWVAMDIGFSTTDWTCKVIDGASTINATNGQVIIYNSDIVGTGDGWCLGAGTYQDSTTAGTAGGSGYIDNGGTVQGGNYPACTFAGASGSTGQTGDGTTSFDVTVAYEGSVTGLVAVDDSAPSGTDAETIDGKAFNGLLDYIAGPVPDPADIEGVPISGDTWNPDIWCDNSGTWTDWGKVSSLVANPLGAGTTGTDPGTISCYQTSGMTLTDPVSWITGAWRDGECLIKQLFEPSSASVEAIQETFGLGGSATCTGALGIAAWTGCLSKAVIATPSTDVASFKTAVDGGACSNSLLGTSGVWQLQAVNRISAPSASFGMCSVLLDATPGAADSSSGTNSAESLVQELLTAAVYIFAILWLVQFLRKTIRSGA